MSLRNERKYSSTGGKKFQNNHRNKQDDDDDDEPLISSKENFDHLTFEIDSLINTVSLFFFVVVVFVLKKKFYSILKNYSYKM